MHAKSFWLIFGGVLMVMTHFLGFYRIPGCIAQGMSPKFAFFQVRLGISSGNTFHPRGHIQTLKGQLKSHSSFKCSDEPNISQQMVNTIKTNG